MPGRSPDSRHARPRGFSRKFKLAARDGLVNDLCYEYLDILQEGRPWKAQWVRARFYFNLVRTVGKFAQS